MKWILINDCWILFTGKPRTQTSNYELESMKWRIPLGDEEEVVVVVVVEVGPLNEFKLVELNESCSFWKQRKTATTWSVNGGG